MDENELNFLKRYSPENYDRISVTADILIFTVEDGKLKILFIKRENYPYKNKFAIPGGFVGIEEAAEDAAIRKLKEKTGIYDVYMEQLYTFTKINRDPRMRIISIAYIAMMPRNKFDGILAKGAELYEVNAGKKSEMFFSAQNGGKVIRANELAFDHGEMVALAVERMRGKLEYTDIAFEFLEDKKAFTLAQLQKIYEALAGKKYDTPNFRRMIKKQYEITGKIRNTGEQCKGSGKSAALYEYIA